jgi:hypothetical protein
MRYVTLICCASAIGLSAQVTSRTMTPDEQIAAAEARGAAFPGANDAEASRRKCTVVRPDQIVFPTTTGDPSAFNLVSGDFSAGSISFGWDRAYQQAKMPLTPRHFASADEAVKLELIRIDPPGETRALEFRLVTGADGSKFFATSPVFSTPGKWIILVTAGINWGCFVIDRPIASSRRRANVALQQTAAGAILAPASRIPTGRREWNRLFSYWQL